MGWARYARTACLIIEALASNQLMPVEKQCRSMRRNARNAKPIWFRCAIAVRAKHLSTPTNCLIPRWYSSIDQDNSAYLSRYSSFIERSLLAQYSMLPFRETILKTLINPYPFRWTMLPFSLIGSWLTGWLPCLSKLTCRFDFNWVSQCHWYFPMVLRFFKLLSHRPRLGRRENDDYREDRYLDACSRQRWGRLPRSGQRCPVGLGRYRPGQPR